MRLPLLLFVLLAGALSVLVAACGGDNSGDDDDGETTPESTGADGESVVRVGEAAGVGPVLTNASGLTLYLFTSDLPGESTCYEACASAWPPLLVEGESVPDVEGIEGELSVIERDDGTQQLALDEMPLYTYASDTTPGEATGHEAGGVWFAALPEGAEASLVSVSGDGDDGSTSTSLDDGYYD